MPMTTISILSLMIYKCVSPAWTCPVSCRPPQPTSHHTSHLFSLSQPHTICVTLSLRVPSPSNASHTLHISPPNEPYSECFLFIRFSFCLQDHEPKPAARDSLLACGCGNLPASILPLVLVSSELCKPQVYAIIPSLKTLQ